MSKKKKKIKLLYVEWSDAMSDNSQWVDEEEALDWGKRKDWFVRECGWLLEETKKYILLASSWSPKSLHPRGRSIFHGLSKIPKGWIKKRKILMIMEEDSYGET